MRIPRRPLRSCQHNGAKANPGLRDKINSHRVIVACFLPLVKPFPRRVQSPLKVRPRRFGKVQPLPLHQPSGGALLTCGEKRLRAEVGVKPGMILRLRNVVPRMILPSGDIPVGRAGVTVSPCASTDAAKTTTNQTAKITRITTRILSNKPSLSVVPPYVVPKRRLGMRIAKRRFAPVGKFVRFRLHRPTSVNRHHSIPPDSGRAPPNEIRQAALGNDREGERQGEVDTPPCFGLVSGYVRS